MATKKANVIDVDRVVSIANRRCDSHGVSIEWVPEMDTAATMKNGKIVLPAIEQPITEQDLNRVYGYIIHECGHHSRSEAFDILEAARPIAPLSAIYNVVEDDGMERSLAFKYPGDAKGLGTGNAIGCTKILDSWEEKKDEWLSKDLTLEQAAPFVIQNIAQLSRGIWDHYSFREREALLTGTHPDIGKYTSELVSEGWVDKFRGTKDPHDTWDVACDLLKRIFPDTDDNELEDVREAGHKMEPGKDPDTDDGKNSLRLDKEEVVSGVLSPDSSEDDKGKGEIVDWKDVVISHHAEWKPRDPHYIEEAPMISEKGYGEGINLMPMNMITVWDCYSQKGREKIKKEAYHTPGIGDAEPYMADDTTARAFANNIRRYLQAKNRVMVDREKKHGRLDKRSIVKLALPPIDGGEYNKKIFYRWRPKQALNTSVHVLVDWSGSMSGTKMKYASDAAGRLVKVFDNILHIPCMVSAFTCAHNPCDIGVIKPYGRRMSTEEIATSFSYFRPFTSGNNDADAVMWAYNQIKKRDEQRKLLIVLSDGCPTDAWDWGCAHTNLQHVTKSIQDEGIVELYGVGICDNSVKDYYNNYQILNSPEEINTALFNVLKNGVN